MKKLARSRCGYTENGGAGSGRSRRWSVRVAAGCGRGRHACGDERVRGLPDLEWRTRWAWIHESACSCRLGSTIPAVDARRPSPTSSGGTGQDPRERASGLTVGLQWLSCSDLRRQPKAAHLGQDRLWACDLSDDLRRAADYGMLEKEVDAGSSVATSSTTTK